MNKINQLNFTLNRIQKCLFLIIIIYSFTLNINAQTNIVNSTNNTFAPFGGKIETFSKINEVLYNKKIIGSFYLDTIWHASNLYLIKDSIIIKNIKTRLDLRNNTVEILHNNIVKILHSNEIRSIFYPNTNSIYLTESSLKGCPSGFYKILINNNTALLCKYDSKLKRSNYNPTLDTGNRDDHLIKTKTYYISNGIKSIVLENLKSKFKKRFKENNDVRAYLENNKFNPRNENDLILLVNYINDNNIPLLNSY